MSLNHFLESLGLYLALHPRVVVRMVLLPLAFIALTAATPAFAQVFKWADENGVTHYSSALPEKAKAKFKRMDSNALAVTQGKTPEPNGIQHLEEQAAQDLTGKIDALEHQVDAERQARQAADAQNLATQAAYAQALADQQAARDTGYIQTIPTVSGLLLVPTFHRRHTDHCRAGLMTNCFQPQHRPRPAQIRLK